MLDKVRPRRGHMFIAQIDRNNARPQRGRIFREHNGFGADSIYFSIENNAVEIIVTIGGQDSDENSI